MKNSVDFYLFIYLGGRTANEPHSLKTSNNAENCLVAQQRSTGSLHSFNYHNSAPFSHIHVQRAKWPIKKTNSISEVLGACLCRRPPLHCHIEHSVGQLNDAWREAGRGASYSQEANSPHRHRVQSHVCAHWSLSDTASFSLSAQLELIERNVYFKRVLKQSDVEEGLSGCALCITK